MGSVQRASRLERDWVGPLILSGVLLWLGIWGVWSWGYWEDDAYIHLAYARSVAQGAGFVFNGAVSNGDTSPLWVMGLALAGSLAPDWVLGGKVLSVLTLVASLWALFTFARRLLPEGMPGRDGAVALLLALIFASPFTLHWAFSGMEALTAAGWIAAASMNLAAERPTWRQTVVACMLLGFGPLLRPEFVLMAPVALPFLWRHAQTVWRSTTRSQAIIRLAFCVLLLIGPLLLWSAYALHAFGYVMPNTNAAKRAAPGVVVPMRLLKLTAVGFPMLLMAAAGLVWTSWRGGRVPSVSSAPTLVPRPAWPLLIWCALVVIFYVVNHTHVQTRYLLVLAPGLLLVSWGALARRCGCAAVLPWLLSGVLVTCAMSLIMLKPLMDNKTRHDRQSEELASVIRERVPTRAPIAIYSIGQIGFLIPNPIIDIGGITQPGATPYLFGPTSDMVAWARRQGAQYYVSGEKPEPDAVLVHSMRMPVVDWFVRPSSYAATQELNLWRLANRPAVSR